MQSQSIKKMDINIRIQEISAQKDVLELCPRYFDVFLQVL